jgi:hypothetical protein
MAFVRREGGKFVVRQGNTGALLSKHSNKKEADDRIALLHRRHKPKRASRGKNASKMFRGKKLPKTKTKSGGKGGRSRSGRHK